MALPSAATALTLGQRVRLRSPQRGKLLWDRASYSASVAAGTEGIVTGDELLDRDGFLTTEAIQELRGYPGRPAYEVMFIVEVPGHFSPSLEDVWVYVEAAALDLVNEPGTRSVNRDDEVERRLREARRETVAWEMSQRERAPGKRGAKACSE
jgi:hypothetical protein